MREVCVGDAGAFVDDRDDGGLIFDAAGEGDFRAGGCVLNGVRDQVINDAAEEWAGRANYG